MPTDCETKSTRPLLKSVGMLAGGTAIAQLISLAAIPLISRLYTPEDFATLAFYAATLGIIGTAGCFRIDVTIPITENDTDAFYLLQLAALALIATSLITCLICGGILLFKYEQDPDRATTTLLCLLPIGVFGVNAFNALQFWTTRKKNFSLLAQTRIIQSAGAATIAVIMGASTFGPVGLLLSHLFNSAGGAFRLATQIGRASLGREDLSRMRQLLYEYRSFPLFSTFEALINGTSYHLPILLLFSLSSQSEIGFLFLALRLTSIPSTLIGAAVGNVFLSDAAPANRERRLGMLVIETMALLGKTCIGPILFVGILSPTFVPHLLGENWSPAGTMIVWLLPSAIVNLMVAPVSMSLHAMKRADIALMLQLIGLALRCSAVLIPLTWLTPIQLYSVSGFVFYLIYLVTIIALSKPSIKMVISTAVGITFIASIWIALAIIILWAIV